jgi:hypothetical protein
MNYKYLFCKIFDLADTLYFWNMPEEETVESFPKLGRM